MKTLKRLTMLILLVSVALGMIACGGTGVDGGAAGKGPIAKAEAIMAEETAAGVPDFTSPPVEDKDLKVPGMPEEVVQKIQRRAEPYILLYMNILQHLDM